MSRASRSLAVVGLALVVFTAPVQAGVEFHEVQDFNANFFVPCANEGAGEFVFVNGNVHFLVTSTINGNNLSGVFHGDYRGVGVGASTGDVYRFIATEGNRFKGSLDNDQFNQTTLIVLNLIGQGRGSNFRVHTQTQITINANGEVSVQFNIDRADCR